MNRIFKFELGMEKFKYTLNIMAGNNLKKTLY